MQKQPVAGWSNPITSYDILYYLLCEHFFSLSADNLDDIIRLVDVNKKDGEYTVS